MKYACLGNFSINDVYTYFWFNLKGTQGYSNLPIQPEFGPCLDGNNGIGGTTTCYDYHMYSVHMSGSALSKA